MQSFFILFGAIFSTALFLLVVFNYRTREVIARYILKPTYSVDDPTFLRAMSGILAADITSGNSVQTLIGGAQIFASMLAEIQKAQHTINLESFICSSGKVCQEFITVLQERAKAGVKINVLLDWMGSLELDNAHYESMKAAGIQIIKYRKPHWYTLPRINNRSHRKILVVDGKIGFTGGVGIGDEWKHGRNGFAPWHDYHYRLEGPIVAKMQAAFLENWLKSHATVLEGEGYFPSLPETGTISAQAFTSAADGIEGVRLMYLFSIACAKKHIRILNAYFVPDRSLVQALIRAYRQGVQIEIIVPGEKTDQRFVREVSRSSWKKLLRAGIPIYEYQPTMHHGKLFIVDDSWVSIGSANCDGRSFAIDDEMNINIPNKEFASEQIALFEQDKAQSKLVTYRDWKKRTFWERFAGNSGRLIGGQF
jgi:cardiolipin synthase